VIVAKRERKFSGSIVRNMRAAGWPWHRIRGALRLSQARVEALAAGSIWRELRDELRRAA
jgi:hypothetical protein